MKDHLHKQYTGYQVAKAVGEQEPRLYQIVLHNDDFTPMEFVMGILEKIFFMERSQAADVMLAAHQQGRTACGIFTKDIAESKIEEVLKLARNSEHPLVCSMETA
jgi:ATP-dependent Clp protease adaptor protein ClpS